jgi:hypothetical protein
MRTAPNASLVEIILIEDNPANAGLTLVTSS